MNKKNIILSLIFVFIGSFVFADTVLTWQQCVDIADANNQTLVSAKQDLQVAQYDYDIALNKYYPSVNFRYGFSRSGNGHTSNNWSTNLSASQTIYDFQSNAEIKSKKASINKTIAQLTKTCADVYCSIKEAFLKMEFAQQNIILLENIYKLRSQSADIVRLQYDGGKESKGNMLRAQAQKQSAYVSFLNAQRELLVAKRSLIQILGKDIPTDFTVEGTLTLLEDNNNYDVDEAVCEIPDVIISSAAIEIAEYRVLSSKGNLYPNLSASASIGLSDETNPFPPLSNKNWSVGVGLNSPILSGGLTTLSNSIKSSKIALEQSKENYEKTKLAAKTELQSALTEIERTRDNIGIYEMLLEAAIQRQKEATVKYRAGTMEFQTWQDIEQEYINNQISHLSALYNYNVALAKRDKILGKQALNANGESK